MGEWRARKSRGAERKQHAYPTDVQAEPDPIVLSSMASAFFASLPEDELSEQEEELLRLLCEITRLKTSFMPSAVSIQMWADKRMPADYISLCNKSSLIFIEEEEEAEEEVDDEEEEAEEEADEDLQDAPWKDSNSNRLQQRDASPSQREASASPSPSLPPRLPPESRERERRKEEAKAYFAWFPYELTDDEVALRGELEKILVTHNRQQITRLNNNPVFFKQFRSALPEAVKKGIVVEDWITNRLAGYCVAEVVTETIKPGMEETHSGRKRKLDEDGFLHQRKHIIKLSSEVRQERSQEEWHDYREQIQEGFFDSLPEDEFTPEEETLRTAIIDYLNESPEHVATLSKVLARKPVAYAKDRFLPLYITPVKWIERRIGQDVDVVDSLNANGQKVLALPGCFSEEAVAKATRLTPEQIEARRKEGRLAYKDQRKIQRANRKKRKQEEKTNSALPGRYSTCQAYNLGDKK